MRKRGSVSWIPKCSVIKPGIISGFLFCRFTRSDGGEVFYFGFVNRSKPITGQFCVDCIQFCPASSFSGTFHYGLYLGLSRIQLFRDISLWIVSWFVPHPAFPGRFPPNLHTRHPHLSPITLPPPNVPLIQKLFPPPT